MTNLSDAGDRSYNGVERRYIMCSYLRPFFYDSRAVFLKVPPPQRVRQSFSDAILEKGVSDNGNSVQLYTYGLVLFM